MSSAPEGRELREFELQLGHLCNDRCVFCESGRLTHEGLAPILSTEMLADRVREAYAEGHRRITFLGGEPTIQPAFFPIVELAVSLGFESIVVFSNGSKAGSTDLVDRVLATGGRFEWRFSVQGATREAHEATTGRKGGFDQVLRALAVVRDRGQKATVNLCLVRSNVAGIERYAELLMPLGVSQVHVDMFNPNDTGGLIEEHESIPMMPRYGDVAPALEQMVHGFPEGFDVSVGSLPFCVVPSLAPWIHHDHLPMVTVTAKEKGTRALKPARFLARSNRKQKPETCTACVFDGHCSGVFDLYARVFGTGELKPVTPEALASLPIASRLVALHLRDALPAAADGAAPWVKSAKVEELSPREAIVTLRGEGEARLRLLFTDRRDEAVAVAQECAVRLQGVGVPADQALEALRTMWSRLEAGGVRTVVPPGPDAFGPTEPSIASRLRLLRQQAPFGALSWRETRLSKSRAEIVLRDADGQEAVVWLGHDGGRPTGGYTLTGSPSEALKDGLGPLIRLLKSYQLP
ncbi:MAG TPA: radical SAM protein [Polyangiaceae bacterium]